MEITETKIRVMMKEKKPEEVTTPEVQHGLSGHASGQHCSGRHCVQKHLSQFCCRGERHVGITSTFINGNSVLVPYLRHCPEGLGSLKGQVRPSCSWFYLLVI
jgi:hypothetical protein